MTHSLFVTQTWLQQDLDDHQVRILDARMRRPVIRSRAKVLRNFARVICLVRCFLISRPCLIAPLPCPICRPPTAQFSRDMGSLGVSDTHHCVVYDDSTLFSAPRAWWRLQTSGVRQVSLLAGGLAACRWKRGNRRPRGKPLPRALRPTGCVHSTTSAVSSTDGSRKLSMPVPHL